MFERRLKASDRIRGAELVLDALRVNRSGSHPHDDLVNADIDDVHH